MPEKSKFPAWHTVCKSGFAVLVAMVTLLPGGAYADGRKDVSDPVLQELITSFAPRMPRFIDKHGPTIFVADEQVTRGSLLYALYEYEKWLKSSRKDFVSKQELDDVQAKIPLLEKKMREELATKLTTAELLTVLQPSMVTLIDSGLDSSKVFSDFRNGLESRQKTAEVSLEMMAGTKAEMGEVIRRVSALEKMPHGTAAASAPADTVTKGEFQEAVSKISQMEKQIADSKAAPATGDDTKVAMQQVQKDMAVLSRRLDGVENKGASPDNSSLEMIAGMKTEMGDLVKKIAAVEKNSHAAVAPAANDETKAAVQQIQRDMATISQRLSGVENKSSGPDASSIEMLSGIKAEMGDLVKRISAVEKSPRASAPAGNDETKAAVQQIQRDVAAISQRLSGVENKSSGPDASSIEMLSGIKAEMGDLVKRISAVEKNPHAAAAPAVVPVDMVKKAELQEVLSRIAQLEKNGSANKGMSADASIEMMAGIKTDMGELIRRVSALEKTPHAPAAAPAVEAKDTLQQMQRDLASMAKRLDGIEGKGNNSSDVSLEMMAGTKSDIGELMKKVATLEKNSHVTTTAATAPADMVSKDEFREVLGKLTRLEKSIASRDGAATPEVSLEMMAGTKADVGELIRRVGALEKAVKKQE
jgi:hypothetical protein